MSTLVTVACNSKYEAEEIRLRLLKMNKEYLQTFAKSFGYNRGYSLR